LQEALDTALTIKDEGAQADALCYLAPKLSEPEKTVFLEKARKAALAARDKIQQAQLLMTLSTQLSEPHRSVVLEEAKTAALAVDNYVDVVRVEKLCELASKLPEPY